MGFIKANFPDANWDRMAGFFASRVLFKLVTVTKDLCKNNLSAVSAQQDSSETKYLKGANSSAKK